MIPGVISNNQAQVYIDQTVKKLGYSKRFGIFTAIDVCLKVDLISIINPDKEYEDDYEEYAAGTILQLSADPSGTMYLGQFSPNGNGTAFLTIDQPSQFVEGKHFTFV